jgi:CheY-like chemotaxis protein
MLAAEDNAVNKKLIPRLLEKAGFPLQAAGDERCLMNRPALAATLDRWIPRPAEAARNSCPS